MFELILYPFAVAIAWVWNSIHTGLVLLGLPDGSGIAWVISIVLVTIVVRVLTIPLYLKQIHSSRGMQAIQPEIKKIQAKYKGKTDQQSRMRMNEEQQALFKKHGTSPFASCLPMLVQMPILFAMYRVFIDVKLIADGQYTFRGAPASALGPIDQTLAHEIDGSTVAGVNLSTTLSGAGSTSSIVTFVVLIAVMVLLQFVSMRMMLVHNTPVQEDPDNPMVRSQKIMLYVMPAMFILTGFIFQMGVLVYMVTGAAWMLLQQMWVLRTMPTPGSPAYSLQLKKRQDSYQEWARPFFAQYDAERAKTGTDEMELGRLNAATLTDLKRQAKKVKIPTNFPSTMSLGEIVTIFRNLANVEWTSMPDEMWMKGVHRQAEKVAERRAQAERREQNKRSSRTQQASVESTSVTDLDAIQQAEERERRRQERRKAERERRRGRKK